MKKIIDLVLKLANGFDDVPNFGVNVEFHKDGTIMGVTLFDACEGNPDAGLSHVYRDKDGFDHFTRILEFTQDYGYELWVTSCGCQLHLNQERLALCAEIEKEIERYNKERKNDHRND